MARIRSIKPEFWEDELIARLPRDARLLFIGLWNFADDNGVLRANPRFVKSKVFPYDEDVNVATLLDRLEDLRFIRRYTIDEQEYLHIRSFLKHQKIDRPSPSDLPLPPEESGDTQTKKAYSTNNRRAIVEPSSPDMERIGSSKGKVSGEEKDSSSPVATEKVSPCSPQPAGFDDFWKAYPLKRAKEDALKVWKQLHPQAGTTSGRTS